jgi:uncharacterized protein DUF6174
MMAESDHAAVAVSQQSATTTPTPATSPSPFLRPFVLWTIIGGALGLLTMLVVVAATTRDPTPSLTPQRFDAARQRWKSAAPANYDIQVRVTGPQAAIYRVEVRGGEPHAAWRNEEPLTSHRTFGTWSVPGMFSTISRDLEAVERHAAGQERQELLLRAAFHPQYGYPQHYRRIEWGSRRGSTSTTVAWDVTEFRVLAPASP